MCGKLCSPTVNISRNNLNTAVFAFSLDMAHKKMKMTLALTSISLLVVEEEKKKAHHIKKNVLNE